MYIFCVKKKKESFIYYKMRKSLLNFQHFCRGKIELGERKVREILFLAEDGHPDDGTILRFPRKWSLKFHLNYLLLNCQKLYSEKNLKKKYVKMLSLEVFTNPCFCHVKGFHLFAFLESTYLKDFHVNLFCKKRELLLTESCCPCIQNPSRNWTILTLVLLNPDIPCLCKQCRS